MKVPKEPQGQRKGVDKEAPGRPGALLLCPLRPDLYSWAPFIQARVSFEPPGLWLRPRFTPAVRKLNARLEARTHKPQHPGGEPPGEGPGLEGQGSWPPSSPRASVVTTHIPPVLTAWGISCVLHLSSNPCWGRLGRGWTISASLVNPRDSPMAQW